MSKLIIVLVITTLVCCIQAGPVPDADADAAAQAGGNEGHTGFGNMAFPQMPNMQGFPQMPNMPGFPHIQMPKMNLMTPEDIANMKPRPGSHYSGMSSNSYSSTKMVDGKPVTVHGGETVVNNDGEITRYPN